MDIVVLLLLLALYLIPEILRRARKPKTYEYPQFPPDNQPTETPPVIREEQPKPLLKAEPVAVIQPAPPPVVAPPFNQSPLPAVKPVVLNNLAYGLVMAEILGPPRSRRQGWKRHQ